MAHRTWDDFFGWVSSTPEGRRTYISRLEIETKDPSQPPVPFNQPTPMQVEAQGAYETNEVVLTVDVKARQVGRSTQEGANQMCSAHSAPASYKVLVATNHQSTTDSSMRRFRKFAEGLPETMLRARPVQINHNKALVRFAHNDALIQHMTVGGTSEAKSWGYHAVVCEEMGKWPNARVNWASIQATLPDACPTHIISTPTGPGTLYAEIVDRVKRALDLGDRTVRLNFWPWYKHPEYRATPPDGWEMDQATADHAIDLGLDPDSDEGRARMYWRHLKLFGPKAVDLQEFRRDFPCNLEEGFLAWEGGWFDLEYVNRLVRIAETADRRPTGEVRFYRRPVPGEAYAIGVDPSKCNGGDYGVGAVLDRAGRLCAVLTLHYGGDVLLAEKVAMLAAIYNGAKILVEANSIGTNMIRHLFNEGCNLWRDITGPSPKDWNTGANSRMHMLSDLRHVVNQGALLIPDLILLREMTHFRDVGGRLEGQDGHNDDHVFALALAEQCRRSLPDAVTTRYHPRGNQAGVQHPGGLPNPHAATRRAATR